MSTGEWERGRLPALDGLRGLAVLLVVVHHSEAFRHADAAGTVGVTTFFTLSGFLITSSLLSEQQRAGRIDLRGFYVRRARRLLPALVAFLAVTAALGIATPTRIASVVLYVSNWALASAGNGALGGLTHTWSLSVEEQFYMMWPLVFILVTTRSGARGLVAFSAVAASVSVATRVALWHDGAGVDRIYFGSDTRADALLIGCLLAAALHRRSARPQRIVALPGAVSLIAVAAVPGGYMGCVVVPLVAAGLTAVVIATAGCDFWLTASWLRFVGRRSYALYLWHFPLIFVVLPTLPLSRAVGLPLVLTVSWGLTLLSWRYVELPFLRCHTPRHVSVEGQSAEAA